MSGNLTSDFRRFQNCHWLNNDRTLNIKSFTDLIYFSGVCKIFKDLIFLMKCMSNFIYRMYFRFNKFSVFEGFFFKEETDIISRFFEILIEVMFPIISIKNGDFLRGNLKVFYESIDLFNCLSTLFRGNKVRNNGVSIFPIKI